MKKFSSEGSFQIEGRGKVITVRNDINRYANFEDLYPKVEVDGIVYTVKGVEHQGVRQRVGCMPGLLVSEEHNSYKEVSEERRNNTPLCPICGKLCVLIDEGDEGFVYNICDDCQWSDDL